MMLLPIELSPGSVGTVLSARWMLEMTREAISVCLRRMAWRLFAVACLLTSGVAAAPAQEFSADIVMRHDDASTPAGHLSVRDGRVRIETTELPDGFFLIDPAKPSAWFVRPARRVYMDARQSSRLTRLFVAVDPDAPCPQWQAMARVAGLGSEGEWRCEPTGEDTIQGRSTVAFRVVPASGQGFAGWVDRAKKFPLRIKTADGALITLEHIRDEPQPASSFELPADARKFSPEALIERIKQSDVWVAKPDEKN
jgi:hypothetical protein